MITYPIMLQLKNQIGLILMILMNLTFFELRIILNLDRQKEI